MSLHFLLATFIIVVIIASDYNVGSLSLEERLSQKMSKDDQRYLQSGNQYFEEKDYHQAIYYYNKILENHSEDQFEQDKLISEIVLGNLAQAYRHLEAYDDSIKAHIKTLEIDPDSPKNHYNYGITLQMKGELTQSISQYLKVLELDSEFLNAYYNIALAYHDLNELDLALKYYSDVLKRDSRHIEARLNTCNILFAMKRYSVAEKCYHDVLTVNPLYVRGIINLASFYHVSMNMSDVYIDPSSSSSTQHVEPSEIYNKQYTYLQVIVELYKQALELEPSNKMAFHGLRSLLQEQSSSELSDSIDSNKDNNNDESYATLVSLGAMDKTSEIDHSYIKELFDSYAYHFEHALVHELKYYSHTLVAEAVEKYYNFTNHPFLPVVPSTHPRTAQSAVPERVRVNILDLGAGTGLACEPVRTALQQSYLRHHPYECGNSTSTSISDSDSDSHRHNHSACGSFVDVFMTGVDLSEKMLFQAKKKQCYQQTFVSEVHDYISKKIENKTRMESLENSNQSLVMSDEESRLDVVIAADVFVYLGNLTSILCSIHSLLTPVYGLLIFTVEALPDVKYCEQGENESGSDNDSGRCNVDGVHSKSNREDSRVGFELQSSGRFAHSYDYIVQVATTQSQCQYRELAVERVSPRENKGEVVRGFLVVLSKK